MPFGFMSKPQAAAEGLEEASTVDPTKFLHGTSGPRDSINMPRHRCDSFQMSALTEISMTSEEQPSKVRQTLWTKPTVDPKDLENRIRHLRTATLTDVMDAPDVAHARIDPESRRFLLWLGLMILLAAYSTASTGYYISFTTVFSAFHASYVFEWLVDAAFLVNMAVQLNVGYVDDEGAKVTSLPVIRRRYLLSSGFVFDLLAALPLDLLQLSVGWTPALRANKYLRLWAMRAYLRRLLETSENPTVINYITLARLILIWLLLPNIFCVIRILLIRDGDSDDIWKNRPRNLDATQHTGALYLRSLHWCMGVMSGYSDGTIPTLRLQYIFTLLVLNIGLFVFAYTVGVIGAIGDGNSQASRNFQISVSALHHFVLRYQLPATYVNRITTYLAHRWESIKSNEKELVTAAELLEELPPCVRYDSVECMTADALNKVPLFARVEEGFIHALTQKMEPVSTSIGETLVRQGEVCDGLYIVLKGTLSIVINGKEVNTLGKARVSASNRC